MKSSASRPTPHTQQGKGRVQAALPASLISRHPDKSKWVREVSRCKGSKQASVMVATLEQPPSFRHARAGMEAATCPRALSVRATHPASPRLVSPVSVCSSAMPWSSTCEPVTVRCTDMCRQLTGSQMLTQRGFGSAVEHEAFQLMSDDTLVTYAMTRFQHTP